MWSDCEACGLRTKKHRLTRSDYIFTHTAYSIVLLQRHVRRQHVLFNSVIFVEIVPAVSPMSALVTRPSPSAVQLSKIARQTPARTMASASTASTRMRAHAHWAKPEGIVISRKMNARIRYVPSTPDVWTGQTAISVME